MSWDKNLTRERYESFWTHTNREPLLYITAPVKDMTDNPEDRRPTDPTDLTDWLLNPERVLPRLERAIGKTYYAGDAFPVAYPVTPALAALQAAFMGGAYRASPENGSGWCDPVIDDLAAWVRTTEVDPQNFWWVKTQELLRAAGPRLAGKCLIGHPDTQGGGQILDSLRGMEKLGLDMIEYPEVMKAAMGRIDSAWAFYWKKMNEIIGGYQRGHADWLGVYSDTPMACPECDLSCMISTDMFKEFFLDSIRFQCETAGRSIYHLDGPGALHHLDTLLGLSCLDGIQWVPGAGAAPMQEWLPVLRRIQAAGKLLHIHCRPDEAVKMVSSLKPQGLYIGIDCSTPAQADDIASEIL